MESYKNSSIKLSLLTVFFIALNLSGCLSHWQGDMAKVVISFGGAGRIAYNSKDTPTHQNLKHDIVFSNNRETVTFEHKGTATFEAYITPGEWTVWVYSWYENDIYAAGTKPDVKLQAGQGNPLKIDMYRAHLVRFDSKGGSSVADQVVFFQHQADKPSPPKRNGYTFDDWYTNTGLTNRFNFSIPITESITLYAKWVPGTDPGNNPALTGTVTISGTATAGQTLTANTGSLGGTGTISYQWTSSFTQTGPYNNISGATSSTYTLAATDAGNYIKVTVSRSGNSGNVTSAVFGPVKNSLAAQLTSLQSNPVENGNYTFVVDNNEDLDPQTLSYNGKTVSITLKSNNTTMRTIKLSGSKKGSLFTVGSGVTLILDSNITLQGHSNNDTRLVLVENNGQLKMYQGSVITGNTSTAPSSVGGGVWVDNGGYFLLDGGTISYNSTNLSGGGVGSEGEFVMQKGNIIDNKAGNNGAGVLIRGGKFTMRDGYISGNKATGEVEGATDDPSHSGGGVVVWATGEFIMEGGEICNNEVYGRTNNYGGGVYVEGTFTMKGGKIYSNTADNGGGVHIWNGIFIKESKFSGGGTIYDNIAPNGGKSVNANCENGPSKIYDINIPSNVWLSYNGIAGEASDDGWDE